MPHTESNTAEQSTDGRVVARLAASHQQFLDFLQRRLEDRALAEDILQTAFARATEKATDLRDEESAIPWFYRILRNAVVDHWRKRARQEARLQTLAAELEATDDPSLREEVCRCVAALLPTLKPEYAEALQRIDLDGTAVKDFAEEAHITANNAGVRVHRARQALRRELERCCGACAEHGCLHCSCSAKSGGQPSTVS